ncbi:MULTISPECIES: hypothetical protein [unclassified Pseudoalteromonas]|uniref:hypothetical protein n=1 Tax=unclassified Pseudoalteromonas TaxID=194690 RepID=UPI00386EA400
MNKPSELLFAAFESAENPLIRAKSTLESAQSHYLFKYLKYLGANNILVENNYFDRDFLSEVSAVYCKSAKGYPNVCKRVHFFSSEEINRELFLKALADDEDAMSTFKNSYLGFIVIRPITNSPFGRTVLKWYPDKTPDVPRVTKPSRKYVSTIAGLELSVIGLAWQQQDSGVAACATIGIWSMLHSSAFDARHSIPTTSIITEAAHSNSMVGHRTYPSYSLTYPQIQHAIKQLGFSPSVTQGDQPYQFFSKRRFANICAAYIRSGYPLMIGGVHGDDVTVGHAVCAVGFRESTIEDNVELGSVYLQDEQVEYLYIHDDNVGPNVRFKLEEEEIELSGHKFNRCVMRMETPDYLANGEEPNLDITSIYPKAVIAAVHDDLMISADRFFEHGINLTNQLCDMLNTYLEKVKLDKKSFAFSSRFLMLKEYLKDELTRQLNGRKDLLANIRIQLQENIVPMSLHLAILRIALPDSSLLLDVIFDTTDTDKNKSVFCHVIYDEELANVLDLIEPSVRLKSLGDKIIAY